MPPVMKLYVLFKVNLCFAHGGQPNRSRIMPALPAVYTCLPMSPISASPFACREQGSVKLATLVDVVPINIADGRFSFAGYCMGLHASHAPRHQTIIRINLKIPKNIT